MKTIISNHLAYPLNVLGQSIKRFTYEIFFIEAASKIRVRLARPARNGSRVIPFEVRAMRLFENGGRGHTGAQKEAEAKDRGGAEVHSNVLEIGDSLYQDC